MSTVSWSTDDALVSRARRILAVHRPGPQAARCQACHQPCPCDAANEAVNTLVRSGASVVDPSGPGAGTAATGLRGLLSRLRERLAVELEWPEER